MDYLLASAGWKTILLVQFQPQYMVLILAGVFLAFFVVTQDLAYMVSGVYTVGYDITLKNFLYGFDAIYFIDVGTMIGYRLVDWKQVKYIFPPRHSVLIAIDAFSCVPTDALHIYFCEKPDLVTSILRMRYCMRIIRFLAHMKDLKDRIGWEPTYEVFREMLTVMGLFMILVNLFVFYIMTLEGFVESDFLFMMHYTMCKMTGKGIPVHDQDPHQGVWTMVFFAFISYVGYVYYISAFISAIMRTMKNQFAYVRNLQSVSIYMITLKNTDHQAYSTIMQFYSEVWKKRKHLGRYDTFDKIIPSVMTKEIKLDLCWDAFKHSHLFRNLDIHYLRYLSSLATLSYLTPGELLFKKGKLKSKMVYITSGVVQLLSREDGETPIFSLSGGTCLGEISLFIDEPSSCSVVCQSFAEVCILKKRAFFRSYNLYPQEFLSLLKSAKLRFEEAKHYVKVNRYQIQYLNLNTKVEVITLRWIKTSLYQMLEKEVTHNCTVTKLEEEHFESLCDRIVFCSRYLDLYNISSAYEVDKDQVLYRSSCPIIFKPNSIILRAWEMFIAALSCLNLLIFGFYLCLSEDKVNLYAFFVYFITIQWFLDIYIQLSTAVEYRDTVVTEISKIASIKFSSFTFFVDIAAAIPFEFLSYVVMGDIDPQSFHFMQVNRLLKSYRIFHLFAIKKSLSPNRIMVIKMAKFITVMMLFTSNIAGLFYILLCKKFKCTVHFTEFLERRAINVAHGSKMMLLCFFLALQFMGGLMLGEFPMESTYWFLIVQISYHLLEVYFSADISAVATLRNKNTLKFREFVFRVNMMMKEWKFSKVFKQRVVKYCNLQWDYDKGVHMFYQKELFYSVPPDLFKITRHINMSKYVMNMPLFSELPDEIISLICINMERIIIPPGEVILYAGEASMEMYVIELGHCEILSDSRSTVKILGPGDSFSVIETCLTMQTLNTVVTLTECKLLMLSYDSYINVMRRFPDIMREITYVFNTAIDPEKLEALLSKDFLEVESYTKRVRCFQRFGFLAKDKTSEDDYEAPFRSAHLHVLKYVLLPVGLRSDGTLLRVYEYFRAVFALLTVIFSPITVLSVSTFRAGTTFLQILDVMSLLDLYVRLHVAYFKDNGIEVTHPLKTAQYYLSHSFIVDFLGVFPFDVVVPFVLRHEATYEQVVFLKYLRQLQFYRTYGMINHMIEETGLKFWIILKYFIVIIVILNMMSSVVINLKCQFDNESLEFDDLYADRVTCSRNSWLSPNESFIHPLSPVRVYAYGLYFMGTISTFKGFEGFFVIQYKESVEIILIISFWLILYPYVSAKIVASVMYRNTSLVIYQSAIRCLIDFVGMKKIDPALENEVIEHFEYIWRKKKGGNEQDIFKLFNMTLHKDALFHIYGSVLENSLVFRGANKSFIKSLLLKLKHEMVLKRGIASRVHDVHGKIFILFKGEIDVAAPDRSYLLTLQPGSVFGTLDNIPYARQTVSFVAKGHVELLTIESTVFHELLSKYRKLRNNFRKLTALNVDYLENIGEDLSKRFSSLVLKTYDSQEYHWLKYTSFFRKYLEVLFRIRKRTTAMKIWEKFILGGVCFAGSIFEIYQKNIHSYSPNAMAVLYMCDFLFLIKMYLQFHTTFDNERGLLVSDRRLIAKRYLKKGLGFFVDFLSVMPIECVALCIEDETVRWNVWSHGRTLRLLRIILVIDYFRGLNQKLNINVFLMRGLYLTACVILTLQGLVYILFLMAEFDPTLEQYNASLTLNFRVMTYMRQVHVMLQLFTGVQVNSYKPNSACMILLSLLMMIVTKFLLAILIAETCVTLEVVYHNKNEYESYIMMMKRSLERGGLSTPLLKRVWMYVRLLWNHHQGYQFPHLLEEAPCYLREGVLNSMFGFHIRRHPILKKCHTELIRQMAGCMRTTIFFTGDYLTFKGDMDECMYFIHEGEVHVLSEDTLYSEIIEYEIKTGEMFGLEQGIYQRCGHNYTYKANSHTLVVTLHRKSWIHILDFFPASKYLIFDKNFQKKLFGQGDPGHHSPQNTKGDEEKVRRTNLTNRPPIIKTSDLRKAEQKKARKRRKRQ